MERCYDLLEPKAKEIMALDDKDGNMQLKGLSWVIPCFLVITECVCWNQPVAYCCPLMIEGPCAIHGGVRGALFHRRAKEKSCPHWSE